MSSYRLSPQQRRTWRLLDQGVPPVAVVALRLPEGIDDGALRAAVAGAAARHDALRTRYESRPGLKIPVQVVAKEAGVDWLDDAEGELAELLAAEQRRPSRADAAPLRVRRATVEGEEMLLLSLPVASADAWSLGNVAAEVVAGLTASAGDEAASEVLQYPKYAGFQNDLAEEDEEREEARAHWRRELAGAPDPRLGLVGAGDAEEGAFSPTTGRLLTIDTAALQALADRLEVGPEVVTGAAWGAWLARLTGGDVTLGYLLPGRDYEILQPAVGAFARAVPVVVRQDGDRFCGDLVRRLVGLLEDASEAADHLVLEDHFPAAAGDEPVRFDALFEPDPRWLADGAVVAKGVVQEPFLVRLVQAGGPAPRLELSADGERLDADAIEALAGGFETFLGAALERPEEAWAEFPWMAVAQERRLRDEVYVGPRLDADLPTVVERIAEACRQQPEAVAVVAGGQVLRRGDLAERSARLAAHLRHLGVGPEVTVGLCLERSTDLVVAMLAIVAAGGAYLPLEPETPAPRRDAMLEAAGAHLLLTRADRVTETAADCRLLDLAAAEAEAATASGGSPPVLPLVSPHPASAAYVIFTSGSTGTPKGVVVEHRQLAAYVVALERRLELPANRPHGFAMMSSPAADAGHSSLFLALCGGGPLVLVDTDTGRDPQALAALFAAHPVDVMKVVSSHLAALLAGGSEAAALLPRRCVLCGGERLEPQLVERIRQLSPDLRVLNHYGPTEATVGILTYEVAEWGDAGIAGALPPGARSVPVGHPLAGSRTYLVDRRGALVPLGVEGELWLGGRQVARGYSRQPALTAAVFVPDPHAEEPGARLYRSGDLARALAPEGAIEFFGRRDEQVKIRGFRIEPAEVARHLETHPEVRAAHVAARQDDAGRPQLVAWVEPVAEAGASETLANGLRVDHLNRNETCHLYDQIFVDRIYDRYGTVYDDGAVIFDVGANIGMFSLFAGLRCQRPRLFAFEPSPYAFDRLRRNLERYGADAELFPAGVSDREGSAELTVYPRASVMSGFHADREAEERLFADAFAAEGHDDGDGGGEASELAAGRFEAERLTRPLTTISAVMRQHGVERIDLLKVDAEKSELEVLEGIEAADWPKIRQLLLEVHDLGDRVERVRRLLESHGYRVVVEEDPDLAGTGIFHVHASRSAPAADAGGEPPPLTTPPPVADLSPAGLATHLGHRLPDYMVPAHFVLLDRLPLNRNGKVDRAALPDPEEAAEAAYVAPVGAAEAALAKIWSEVLGRDRVGVEDNFFELGGDSILSIQVAAQARRAGLRLATRQLFQHQTIRELAAAVEEVAAAVVDAEQGRVTGPVPPTPIQRWFHAEGFADPDHFNQSVLLTVRRPVDDVVLRATVARLVDHHDALRLRLVDAEGGGPRQEIVAEATTPFAVCDLSALPAGRRPAAVSAASAAHQRSLDLRHGPLLRVAHFAFGAGEPGRLLVVVHHLVIDGVSWRILLGDLQSAYSDLAGGGDGGLPPKTTSFATWARRLEALAAEPETAGEAALWAHHAAPAEGPAAAGGRPPAAAGAAESLSRELDAKTTGALLGEVPAAYQVQVPEVLVAALAGALRQVEDSTSVGVVLEGHGREELFEDVDLSRTLGWFTTHYPVRLEAPAEGGPGALLKAVKETLRGLPRGGVGYGLLRHSAPSSEAVEELRGLPSQLLKFNYLGRFDQVLAADSPFAPAFEDKGRERSPRAHRPYPLELDALVSDGRLRLVWTFDPDRVERSRVEAWAEAYQGQLQALVAHCLSGDDAGYTPSDFPMADLDQGLLDEALLEADFEMRGDS